MEQYSNSRGTNDTFEPTSVADDAILYIFQTNCVFANLQFVGEKRWSLLLCTTRRQDKIVNEI